MNVLDWAKGKRRRTTYDGAEWRHFPCPFCLDTSAHLGVCVENNRIRYRCFRCSASSKYPGAPKLSILNSPVPEDVIIKADVPPAPSTLRFQTQDSFGWCKALLAASMLRAYLETSCAILWPALPWASLCRAGMKYDPVNQDCVILPYYTLNGVQGYQIRKFTGTPKVITVGPRGPALLAGETQLPGPWIVVEGWMDAVAVPPYLRALILMGTGDDIAIEQMACLKGQITLALDGDEPGRKAQRRIALGLLKRSCTVRWVQIPTNKDPADIGRKDFQVRFEAAPIITELRSLDLTQTCQGI